MSANLSASEVRIVKSVGYRILAKKALRAILWLMLLALIIYGALASSVVRYTATNLGTLKIVSPNFPGGQAPAGAAVAVDPEGGYDGNPLKNLLTAITPHSHIAIGEVLEGPYGTPDWEAYGLPRDKEEKLSDQYIVKCLEGCEKDGSFLLVSSDQIMGIPVVER